MNITPKDILDKEFSTKFKGYSPEEVDEFLDEIIKQFESLLEENENVIAKNEQLKSDIAKLKVKADKVDDIEEKLMSTVITAQRNASLYIERAEEQAKSLIDMANQNAKAAIESTQLRMEAAQQELRNYERTVANYKKRFRMFLEEQFAATETRLESEDFMGSKAIELSHSINQLKNQMKAFDQEQEETTIHLNDILKKKKDDTDYDLKKSTENLQEIVNEIIDE